MWRTSWGQHHPKNSLLNSCMEKKSEISQKDKKALVRKMIVRFSFFPLVLALLILLPAGTFNYWQVYMYFGILVIPMIFVLLYFLKNDPKFLERRAKAKEKEKQQVLISMLSTSIFLAGFIVPGLDHRFAWSSVPMPITILADILILLGYLIIFFVFRPLWHCSPSHVCRCTNHVHPNTTCTWLLLGINPLCSASTFPGITNSE